MRVLMTFAVMALTSRAGAALPLLSLAANPKEGATATEYVQGVLDARKMGLGMMFTSQKWSDLEPKPGQYSLKQLGDAVGGLGSLGFRVALTLQTLDTNNRTLPPDLMGKPFDSPEMLARLDTLLEHISPKLTDKLGWVMVANEADIYLGIHPDELPHFSAFAEHARATLRRLKPGLKVGVTCTYDGLRDRPSVVSRLNREMDFVALTYYPMDPAMGVRPVSEVGTDFDRMARDTAAKPLLLQEIGYPAAPLLGSSEEKQAAFVDAVFDAVKKHSDRIACFSFFLLHDFGDKLTDTFVRYYGVNSERFRAFLGTLGMRKADGSPRKAWSRFEARAKEWVKERG